MRFPPSMLPALTLGFLAGLLLGSYAPFLPLTITGLLLLCAVTITVLEHRGALERSIGHAAFLAGLVGLLYWTISIHPAPTVEGSRFFTDTPVRLTGVVRQPVRQFPGRAVLVLTDCRFGPDGIQTGVLDRVRVTWREADAAFLLGDRVVLTGKLRAPSGFKNPGGFDYGGYLEHQGIEAVISVTGPGQVALVDQPATRSWWTPWRIVERWRERLRISALHSLDESAAGVYLGMILGQSGYVTPDARDTYMATGTVHILSISGSHLGLIAMLCFWSIRGASRILPSRWFLILSRRITPTRLAAVLTVPPVTFYTLLAGYEVATVRSCLMIMLFLWALWLGRPNPVLVTLCTAALAILLHDPAALFDISFQLSFLSVLAIGLALPLTQSEPDLPPEGGWSLRDRLHTWLTGYSVITGSVTLATVPLVALYFNQIAWLGLVANLIIIPFAGFVVVPLGLASAVWGLVAGGDALPAAALNQMMCDGFNGLVHLFAQIPGSEWHVASPAVPMMVLYYGALLILLVGWQRLARGATIPLVTAVVLMLGWWTWSPRWAQDSSVVRVTFLDVGQGDATVVEFPEGKTILIDGGSSYDSLDLGRAVVGPYLWDRGIRQLDHLIGTHPQLDHVGGLASVARKFVLGRYWGNGIDREERFHQRLRDELRAKGIPEERAEAGLVLAESPSCRLVVLNPPRSEDGPSDGRHGPDTEVRRDGSALNNLSVVTRLTCGTHAFLFAADIESKAMQRMLDHGDVLQSEVLKVPHHGALSSLHDEWIGRVHAGDAVVSAGPHNPYGHPVERVLTAYRGVGSHVWITRDEGAVWMTASIQGSGLQIHSARERALHPVLPGSSMMVEESVNLTRVWQRWIES